MKVQNAKQLKALVVSDFSALGRCSVTAALPILSALGHAPCALPTALLSSQTGGVSGYSFCDLSEEIPKIQSHWKSLDVSFDGAFTGYFAGAHQISAVTELLDAFPVPLLAVDPIMADGGSYYDGFDDAYAAAIKPLCARADVLLPNLTEACLLTGTPYRENANFDFAKRVAEKLLGMGTKSVVLKGFHDGGKIGVVVADESGVTPVLAKRIAGFYHGAGDVFGAVVFGLLLQGNSLRRAVRTATDFTSRAICRTHESGEDTRLGLQFEPLLKRLCK